MTEDMHQDNDTIDNRPAPGTHPEPEVPIGIARIREEWRAAGLKERPAPTQGEEEPERIVFTEVDGGAGIGDYTLDADSVMNALALSQEAFDRLISCGEIDSVLVQTSDGTQRRMISESSVRRFEADAAIDPDAIRRAAQAMADRGVSEAIRDLQSEIDELRNTQGRILQQMKDMLLLEVRNLKEQDRDLASFVYELAEEIRSAVGKKKKK